MLQSCERGMFERIFLVDMKSVIFVSTFLVSARCYRPRDS